MKIALLSDIHGNADALEAVLKDIEDQGGVDTYYIVGDLVALGPEPNRVLDILTSLEGIYFLQGNTDRYVIRGERPFPSQKDVLENSSLLPRIIDVTNGFSWTQGMITAGGWFDFLANLPFDLSFTLPNQTKIVCLHAEPNSDEATGVHPDVPDEKLEKIFAEVSADIVFVGHTHWPAVRQLKDKKIVNLGSVSNPRISSLEATYVILKADQTHHSFKHRFVPYDRAKVIEKMRQVHCPSMQFVTRHLNGEFVKKSWKMSV